MSNTSNGNNLIVQGRIVWTVGDLFAGKKKTDMNTNQPVLNANGDQVVEYGFGLAIPKVDGNGQPTPEFQKIWQALHNEAYTLYPNGQLPPNFAMKYKDGDGIDHNGKSFADREGHAGHIILTCTTQIPIKYFIFQGGNNILVNDGIKAGDYVNAQLNIKAHPAKGNAKAGLYVNPSAVQLIQPGKEIINTPSGDQIFSTNAPSYAGQVVAPEVNTMPNMQQAPAAPGMPGAPTQGQQAPGMPGQPAQEQQTPAHYGVLPQNMQQGQQAPATSGQMQSTPNNMNGMSTPSASPSNGMTPPAAPGNVAPSTGMMAPQYTGQPAQGTQGNVPPAYPSNGMPAMPGMPQ